MCSLTHSNYTAYFIHLCERRWTSLLSAIFLTPFHCYILLPFKQRTFTCSINIIYVLSKCLYALGHKCRGTKSLDVPRHVAVCSATNIMCRYMCPVIGWEAATRRNIKGRLEWCNSLRAVWTCCGTKNECTVVERSCFKIDWNIPWKSVSMERATCRL
jgi:hypothetical protein